MAPAGLAKGKWYPYSKGICKILRKIFQLAKDVPINEDEFEDGKISGRSMSYG
jgi:hypothetical protein